MDNIEEHISKIKAQTHEIRIVDIEMVVEIMKKGEDPLYCPPILQILWQHMEAGFVNFDDQLFCSTCFYTILSFSNERESYLKKILQLLNIEIEGKEKGIEMNNSTFHIISLTYGIFQSPIMLQNLEEPMIAAVLSKSFTLLILMAYEYSQYTYITFKIMTFFKKVIGTNLQNIIFNKNHNFKLLNVINHNWENPITGVRGLNKIIFQNLISVVDEIVYEVIEQKLNSFYWNKAKYLMLAEIIEHYQGNISVLLEKYYLVEGLIYSLKKSGLVSAGADMYVAILKKLTSAEDWCAILLSSIIGIIKGSSIKPIENFNNYWCQNTFKKYPILSQIIFDEVKKINSSDHKLYSCLCIIQQSNRLGLLEKHFNLNDYHINNLLLNHLEDNDIQVRLKSFDIFCGLHRQGLPDEGDYHNILNFLNNNVNCDSHILRMSLIKSFQNFLVQLHIAFVKFCNNWNSKDCENFVKFCSNIQSFVIESLDFNGNYQRKIATIQIIKVIHNTFKAIPKKNQKRTKQLHSTLMDFIKVRKQWKLSEKIFIFKLISLLKDPSDDIREHIKEILLYNYSDLLCKSYFIIYLTEEALVCMRSRFFYQISCGQTIFKVIANILMMENCTEGHFKKVEDIFTFAYDELKSECNSDIDIVKSIVGGKQLHSYISVLQCIFEVCLEKSHILSIPINIIYSLITILKLVSNQFAWEQETMISSDFSKINDMVQKIIDNSEYQIHNLGNDTSTSSLHQIVLNCMWLNVKACCELSAILVKYYKNDVHTNVCQECVNIICNVLETSRHKGAIEAGGAALGLAIQQLTSVPSSSENSKLPMIILKNKFYQLVLETNNMASVTRRGAGLSVMIHRIVSNDMKKGKPLFHYFMQSLLETCYEQPEYRNDSELLTSNEKDIPKAIYMHFLTKIVTDSSLASDMMYYSGKLAKLAFDNLSSSCWQIRNAALQLYGSLVPKLIGQKKNSGSVENVRATVAVDEFRTHSPILWEYIQTQLILATKSHCDIVQCHNNLVPILSVVANLSPRYSFTNELELNKDLLAGLTDLLGSPLYVVRGLSSKCILNIYTYEIIFNVLLNATCETENSLHGNLLLLNKFKQHYNPKNIDEKTNVLLNKYNVFMTKQVSYLSRERFENTYPESINLTENMIQDTFSELHANCNAPGIFLWANCRIKLYIETVSWNSIPQIVKVISECSDFDIHLETLCNKLQAEKFIEEDILIDLSSTLYLLGFQKNNSIIWKMLYKMSLHTQSLNNHIDVSLLHQYFLNNEVSYSMRYTIAFAARLFTNYGTGELVSLSNIIINLCYPEADVDMRLIAAIAINELAHKFVNLSDHTKINIIKATTILLQDEDEDVRKVSVNFYKTVNVDATAVHPYICWHEILSRQFLYKVLDDPQPAIISICNGLLDLLKSLSIENVDEYNPFATNTKNIYLEPEVLKKVLSDLTSC